MLVVQRMLADAFDAGSVTHDPSEAVKPRGVAVVAAIHQIVPDNDVAVDGKELDARPDGAKGLRIRRSIKSEDADQMNPKKLPVVLWKPQLKRKRKRPGQMPASRAPVALP